MARVVRQGLRAAIRPTRASQTCSLEFRSADQNGHCMRWIFSAEDKHPRCGSFMVPHYHPVAQMHHLLPRRKDTHKHQGCHLYRKRTFTVPQRKKWNYVHKLKEVSPQTRLLPDPYATLSWMCDGWKRVTGSSQIKISLLSPWWLNLDSSVKWTTSIPHPSSGHVDAISAYILTYGVTWARRKRLVVSH